MPGQTTPSAPYRIIRFTNCRIIRDNQLIEQNLCVDAVSGKIVQDQEVFYGLQICPDEVVDLGGRILCPGFIEAQLNGAYGFDFSVPQDSKERYDEGLSAVNRELVKTGVTSYLPTVISSTAEVYWKVHHISHVYPK